MQIGRGRVPDDQEADRPARTGPVDVPMTDLAGDRSSPAQPAMLISVKANLVKSRTVDPRQVVTVMRMTVKTVLMTTDIRDEVGNHATPDTEGTPHLTTMVTGLM